MKVCRNKNLDKYEEGLVRVLVLGNNIEKDHLGFECQEFFS